MGSPNQRWFLSACNMWYIFQAHLSQERWRLLCLGSGPMNVEDSCLELLLLSERWTLLGAVPKRKEESNKLQSWSCQWPKWPGELGPWKATGKVSALRKKMWRQKPDQVMWIRMVYVTLNNEHNHFVTWLYGFNLVLLNLHRIVSRSKEGRSGVRHNENNSKQNSYG